jgi:hypothetical protein
MARVALVATQGQYSTQDYNWENSLRAIAKFINPLLAIAKPFISCMPS